MVERKEWPTERRLAELREQGRIPYSKFATSAATAAGVVSIVALAAQQYQEFFELWRTKVYCTGIGYPGIRIIKDALALVCIPVAGALLAGAAVGLVQTRFLFRPSIFNGGARESIVDRFRWGMLVLRVLSVLGAFSVAVLSSLVMSSMGLREFLKLISIAAEGSVPVRDVQAGPVLWGTAVVLIVAAVTARLAAVARFRYTHRMSQAEVRAEQ